MLNSVPRFVKTHSSILKRVMSTKTNPVVAVVCNLMIKTLSIFCYGWNGILRNNYKQEVAHLKFWKIDLEWLRKHFPFNVKFIHVFWKSYFKASAPKIHVLPLLFQVLIVCLYVVYTSQQIIDGVKRPLFSFLKRCFQKLELTKTKILHFFSYFFLNKFFCEYY